MRPHQISLLLALAALVGGCPWHTPDSVPPELDLVRASVAPQPSGLGPLQDVIPGEVLDPMRAIDGCWARWYADITNGVPLEVITYLRIDFADRRIAFYDLDISPGFAPESGVLTLAEGSFKVTSDGRIRARFSNVVAGCVTADGSDVAPCATAELFRLGAMEEPADWLVSVDGDALKMLRTEPDTDRSYYVEGGLEAVNDFSEEYTRLECP